MNVKFPLNISIYVGYTTCVRIYGKFRHVQTSGESGNIKTIRHFDFDGLIYQSNIERDLYFTYVNIRHISVHFNKVFVRKRSGKIKIELIKGAKLLYCSYISIWR